MACLFGYFGPPVEGLLDRMAGLLAHRCPLGWERIDTPMAGERRVEIGHGIASWCRKSQLAVGDQQALGYGGVLFNTGVTAGTTQAERLLSNLRHNPATELERLEGAFVLAFAQQDTGYLLRDHAGVKALYWTVHRGRLLFASEIKALFADPTVPRQLRPGALPEYLTFSFIPGPRTMLMGIEELQPGCILTFSQGQVRIHRHFQCELLEETAPDDNYPQQVRTALEQSVADCLAVNPGKTPAVFLSGGIDSSAVLAVTCQQLPEVRIPTFSVHFGEEYARENEFVSLMVERYRTDHHWLEVRPAGFLERLRDIIWKLDDPIGDPVAVPNYLLARAAAQVTDCVLNGEGGDPCFGGPKNIPMLLTRLYGCLPGEPANGWLERDYLRSFQRCYQDLYALLTPDMLQESGGDEALTGIVEPFFHTDRPRDFVNKLMHMNIRLKGANLILVKVDKMSSANGLLALPPLFSKRIIETSMRCPAGLKLEGAVEKSVLKKAVYDLIPQAIIDRPKSGMMVPVRFWFQGEMRRYGKRMLSRKNLNRLGLFNPEYVQRLLNYDMEGVHGARHGLKLWMLLTFLLWYEQMIETPAQDLPNSVPPVPQPISNVLRKK